eukprot:GHVL01023792.1.p1 GENE.GHVL01023792.1~~GHVL01023792.1.p1  ORF type:complete len:746 (-),score=103.47 GHVL01023792.1:123-2360(-)
MSSCWSRPLKVEKGDDIRNTTTFPKLFLKRGESKHRECGSLANQKQQSYARDFPKPGVPQKNANTATKPPMGQKHENAYSTPHIHDTRTVLSFIESPKYVFDLFSEEFKAHNSSSQPSGKNSLYICHGFKNLANKLDPQILSKFENDFRRKISHMSAQQEKIENYLNEWNKMEIEVFGGFDTTWDYLNARIVTCANMLFSITLHEVIECDKCKMRQVKFREVWTIPYEEIKPHSRRSDEYIRCPQCKKGGARRIDRLHSLPYYIISIKKSFESTSSNIFLESEKEKEKVGYTIKPIVHDTVIIYRRTKESLINWQNDMYSACKNERNGVDESQKNTSGPTIIENKKREKHIPVDNKIQELCSILDKAKLDNFVNGDTLKWKDFETMESVKKWTDNKSCKNVHHRGLVNNGNYCFMNAVVQCLSHASGLAEFVLNFENVNMDERFMKIKYHFNTIKDENFQKYSEPLYDTFSEMNPTMKKGHQHDSSEYFNNFLSYLEDAEISIRCGDEPDIEHRKTCAIAKMFGGVIQHFNLCKICKKLSSNKNHFFSLALDIARCDSIDGALRNFVLPYEMTGSVKLFCSKCKEKTECIRQSTLKNLPVYLTFQIGRFGSNGEKLQTSINISTTLNMKPYIEEDKNTCNGQSNNTCNGQSNNTCNGQSNNTCNGQSNNTYNGQDNKKKTKYELYGVVNHYGRSVNEGHYKAYSKCPCDGKWRLFDDTYVEVNDTRSMLKDISDKCALVLYKLCT